MAEPEAAMGGLWLASLTAVAESEQRCETSPAAEIMSLEGHAAELVKTSETWNSRPVRDM